MKKTMADYISEAAVAVTENLQKGEALTKPLVEEFVKKDYKTIWIVASGSSYNGSLCARDFVREYLKVEVKIIPPATFNAFENNFGEDDFVFVVSQTGYSTNALESLNILRGKGVKVIGVTGNVKSDFKGAADLVVDYGLGIETVGYVTKGVTTFVAFMMMFAVEAGKRLKRVSAKKADAFYKNAKAIMAGYPKTIADTNAWIEKNMHDFSSMQTVYLCSIGSNYGTVVEGALKISETVHIPAIPYEVEEVIHGPYLQMNPTYTILFLDTDADYSARVQQIYQGSKEVTNRAFLVSNKPPKGDGKALGVMKSPDELLNPLVYLPVVQTIAAKISSYLETKQHPLLAGFKKKAISKSANYVDND